MPRCGRNPSQVRRSTCRHSAAVRRPWSVRTALAVLGSDIGRAASPLAGHLGGPLVRSPPAPAGLPQPATGRPFRESYFADQVRLDPVRIPGVGPRDVCEGTGGALAVGEPRSDRVEVLVGEPGADLADVVEARRAGDAEQQRADAALAASGARRPAADDDLLLPLVLQLQPVA